MADTSTSGSKAGESSKTTAPAGAAPIDEIDKLLAQEETAFQRDLEVERILKAFKLNPYAVLDVEIDATPADIKKRFRYLSLYIHPDKASHPRASEAFDLMKKAESDLSDKEKREALDYSVSQARVMVMKTLSLPTDTPDSHPKLSGLKPTLKELIRDQTKQILIDDEVARRKAIKMNLANEGLEAKRKEEETEKKKRKAEEELQWEATRETRVDSWRSFQTGKKKKKTKLNVLG